MSGAKDWLMIAGIAAVTYYLTEYFAWYTALGTAVFALIVAPPFIKAFLLDPIRLKSKLAKLPSVDLMPEVILKRNFDLTEWESKFISDMRRKFQDEDFKNSATRKQCLKLVEIYLERVSKISLDQVDLGRAKISLGERIL